jgi:aspartyl-tRNA(Asn)/glutamyl-tRNA(Gln) amidotransferase subunit B
MEKGTMRLEANISLSADGALPDYKVELKNINSFKFLEKALKAEIERQTIALEKGEKLIQETRGYDEKTKTTFSQRVKADSHDYRYFPEADLPPISLGKQFISEIRDSLPELPQAKRDRFEKEHKLSKDYVNILVSDLDRANYFEKAAHLAPDMVKQIADLMINKNLDSEFAEPASLVKKIVEITKVEFAEPTEVSDAVYSVVSENPDIVMSYKNGKGQVIGFLIGQVQKILQGKGDPKLITAELIKKLNAN